jgi:putative endonuclease
MHGWLYILKCADDSYYTGSTEDLQRRFLEHQNGLGANHTGKRLPVKLVYTEAYPTMQQAFWREKQIQGWSRKKKEALIDGRYNDLPELATAYRDKQLGSLIEN